MTVDAGFDSDDGTKAWVMAVAARHKANTCHAVVFMVVCCCVMVRLRLFLGYKVVSLLDYEKLGVPLLIQ